MSLTQPLHHHLKLLEADFAGPGQVKVRQNLSDVLLVDVVVLQLIDNIPARYRP